MNSTVQRHAKDGISQFNVYRSEFILGGKKKKKGTISDTRQHKKTNIL